MVHAALLERIAALLAAPEEADAIVDRWLRRFRAIADRGLRRHVLLSCIVETDDAGLVAALDRLDARAAGGDADCRWLAAELALTPAVLHDLEYQRRTELYAAAREAGRAGVARKFLGARPAPAGPQGNPHLDISAGERTAAARATNRLVLDRLLHDRDPRVVAALLDNPRIVERDVVHMAALRPTSPAVLEKIAAHPRWSGRYRVRKALAFNPSTPTPLARQLLPTLLRQDLVELAQSGVLSPDLRAELLSLR